MCDKLMPTVEREASTGQRIAVCRDKEATTSRQSRQDRYIEGRFCDKIKPHRNR